MSYLGLVCMMLVSIMQKYKKKLNYTLKSVTFFFGNSGIVAQWLEPLSSFTIVQLRF